MVLNVHDEEQEKEYEIKPGDPFNCQKAIELEKLDPKNSPCIGCPGNDACHTAMSKDVDITQIERDTHNRDLEFAASTQSNGSTT